MLVLQFYERHSVGRAGGRYRTSVGLAKSGRDLQLPGYSTCFIVRTMVYGHIFSDAVYTRLTNVMMQSLHTHCAKVLGNQICCKL